MKKLNQILAEATAHHNDQAAMHKVLKAHGWVETDSTENRRRYVHSDRPNETIMTDAAEAKHHSWVHSHAKPGPKQTNFMQFQGSIKAKSGKAADLESHLKSGVKLTEEMTDDEIEAHNDSFNDKVAHAHDKYITKKYGKNAEVNWGAVHDEDGEHGEFTSKVYHPKKGKIYVTTHYNTKTHEVHKHTED